MKKSIVVLFSVLALASQASPLSIDKLPSERTTAANYELAERFSSQRLAKMLFSTQVAPMWFSNSDAFVYRYKTSKGEKWYRVDSQTGKKEEVIDMDQLAMQLTEIMQDPLDAQHLPMEDIKLEGDRYLTFSVTGSQQAFFFRYDMQTRTLENVTEQNGDLKYPYYAVMSPDGTKGVYVKGHDLYLMDVANLRKAALCETDSTLVEVRLTEDGTHDFCWGADNYKGDISQNSTERVRPSTVVWSPDSKLFATIRWDMTRIRDAWVINSLSSPRPTLETFKFQMPGEAGADGYLYLFDTDTKKYRQIQTSAYKEGNMAFEYHMPKNKELCEDYSGYVWQWLGDERGFYLTCQSRDHKKIDLCYVSVGEDSTRTVIREQMNTFMKTGLWYCWIREIS